MKPNGASAVVAGGRAVASGPRAPAPKIRAGASVAAPPGRVCRPPGAAAVAHPVSGGVGGVPGIEAPVAGGGAV